MATDLAQTIYRALADMRRFGGNMALVGGFAVGLRSRPRTTKDIDFTVAVSGDGDAEALLRNFLQAGYKHHCILENTKTGRLATARLYMPDSTSASPDLDLLFATCGIENEIVAAATLENIADTHNVPVARIGHLIAMKILSERKGRPQDRLDLEVLVKIASKQDILMAQEGVKLIAERGYGRTKNLKKILKQYLTK